MQANSPSSYLASLALHGLAAGIIFAITVWISRQNPQIPPVIFELVAGPPTNPNATVAGTGTPEIEVDLPEIKPLSKEAMRPRVEETPAPTPATVQPKVETQQPVRIPPKQETRKVEPKKKAEEPKKISYDQFVKQHGRPQPKQTAKASTNPVKVPRINMDQALKELRQGGGGGQGGKAETREDQGLLANYLAQLRMALQRAYERPPGVPDGLEVELTFSMAANGDISNVRVTRSSGDPDFDRAAAEAFRRVGSIGPIPNRRATVLTMRFQSTED